MVMRETRLATRLETDKEGSLYGALARVAVAELDEEVRVVV